LPSPISSPISFLFSFGSRVPAARFWLAGRGRISLDWISRQFVGSWVQKSIELDFQFVGAENSDMLF
jgi:hypothetical protein